MSHFNTFMVRPSYNFGGQYPAPTKSLQASLSTKVYSIYGTDDAPILTAYKKHLLEKVNIYVIKDIVKVWGIDLKNVSPAQIIEYVHGVAKADVTSQSARFSLPVLIRNCISTYEVAVSSGISPAQVETMLKANATKERGYEPKAILNDVSGMSTARLYSPRVQKQVVTFTGYHTYPPTKELTVYMLPFQAGLTTAYVTIIGKSQLIEYQNWVTNQQGKICSDATFLGHQVRCFIFGDMYGTARIIMIPLTMIAGVPDDVAREALITAAVPGLVKLYAKAQQLRNNPIIDVAVPLSFPLTWWCGIVPSPCILENTTNVVTALDSDLHRLMSILFMLMVYKRLYKPYEIKEEATGLEALNAAIREFDSNHLQTELPIPTIQCPYLFDS